MEKNDEIIIFTNRHSFLECKDMSFKCFHKDYDFVYVFEFFNLISKLDYDIINSHKPYVTIIFDVDQYSYDLDVANPIRERIDEKFKYVNKPGGVLHDKFLELDENVENWLDIIAKIQRVYKIYNGKVNIIFNSCLDSERYKIVEKIDKYGITDWQYIKEPCFTKEYVMAVKKFERSLLGVKNSNLVMLSYLINKNKKV